MAHKLPALPYEFTALEPHIDALTMEIHHSKHHQAYVNNLNAALEGHSELADKTALELVMDLDSVPDDIKERLLQLSDQRITSDGIIVIKAQSQRTREQNRQSALHRLQEVIKSVTSVPKKRKPTKPTAGSKTRRLDKKSKRARTKALRSKITE